MATRRYRKSSNKSKKSLKKRGSRRRKNIRSSRRMRGGIPNLLDLFTPFYISNADFNGKKNKKV